MTVPPSSSGTERAAFEDWWMLRGKTRPERSTEPGCADQYAMANAEMAWRGWQARGVAQAPRGPMVPWELKCLREVCAAPECDCPPVQDGKGESWEPIDFWKFVSGLAGGFEANQMRDMLTHRGLQIVGISAAAYPPLDLEADMKAHGTYRDTLIEDCAKIAAAWEKPSFALMRAGEMTAQELRTVIAVAGNIATNIRALSLPSTQSTAAAIDKAAEEMANRWPLGCHSPNSCSRSGCCMYVGCKHDGQDIRALATAFSSTEGK